MTCQKVPYRTKKEAEKNARGLSRRKFGGFRTKPFVTVYLCPECSDDFAIWHMTRSKPRHTV